LLLRLPDRRLIRQRAFGAALLQGSSPNHRNPRQPEQKMVRRARLADRFIESRKRPRHLRPLARAKSLKKNRYSCRRVGAPTDGALQEQGLEFRLQAESLARLPPEGGTPNDSLCSAAQLPLPFG